MSEMISMQGKPTFRDRRKQAKTRDGQPITQQEIATRAGLTSGEMYAIEIGGYSSLQNIQAALRVFNELTGQRLTMNDIRHEGIVE